MVLCHYPPYWGAYKVNGTDLRGTQLVVLSTCETGLGAAVKVQGKESKVAIRQSVRAAMATAAYNRELCADVLALLVGTPRLGTWQCGKLRTHAAQLTQSLWRGQ